MGYYYSIQPWLSNSFILSGLLTFVSSSFDKDIVLYSDNVCRVIWSFRYLATFSNQYFLVQMTVDRALSILYPRRFNWLSSPRNLAKITISIVVAFGVYGVSLNVYRRVGYNFSQVNGTWTRIPSTCSFRRVELLANNFTYVIIRLSGLILTFLLNMAIIKRLIDSKNNIRKYCSSTTNQSMSHKELVFIVSLLSTNFIQVITWTPFLALNIVQLVLSINGGASPQIAGFVNALFFLTLWGNFSNRGLSIIFNVSFNSRQFHI